MVKMPLSAEVGGHALKSNGNYVVDHGIVFLNFCGSPDDGTSGSDITPFII